MLFIRHRFIEDYEELSQSYSKNLYLQRLAVWISRLNVTDNNPVNSDKICNRIHFGGESSFLFVTIEILILKLTYL